METAVMTLAALLLAALAVAYIRIWQLENENERCRDEIADLINKIIEIRRDKISQQHTDK